MTERREPPIPAKINWLYLLLFYGIAFGLSAPANSFYYIAQWHELTTGTVFYNIPFYPACIGTLIAALLAFKFDKGVVKTVSLWGNHAIKNTIIACIPAVVVTIVGIPNTIGMNEHVYALLLAAVVLVYAFCEEIFWRGYVINALWPMGWVKNYLVLGILWWAWHFNFSMYGLTTFLLMVLIGTYLIGKFAEGTRSYLATSGPHALITLLAVGGNSTPLLYAGGVTILLWMAMGQFWKAEEANG